MTSKILAVLGVILGWFSGLLLRKTRQEAQDELRQAATQDQAKRRTAGEIAANAALRAQENREQKYDSADSRKKLEELRREFGPRRNNWGM